MIITFHIKRDTCIGMDQYRFHEQKWCIVDTIDHGRIMFTHTKDTGKFRLGIETVKEIFKENNCDSMITCYPAKHYKLHPRLAKQLDILFPECTGPTWNTWKIDENIVKVYDDDDYLDY